ncbi:Uncharacterised protein [Klebsiella pneumoniae]|nr:Uncharacterised protein [Klebsiella pneumoniae]SXU22562.1 Uncharacterised protein [Klebsiella pneumoniae]VGE65439.1 Uncharacterised protein [Klebsiella pneumoniae]
MEKAQILQTAPKKGEEPYNPIINTWIKYSFE